MTTITEREDILPQAEDPEVMLNQLIKEMQGELAQAQERLIDAIAAQKRLERGRQKLAQRIAAWQSKADAAARAKDNAGKRLALRQVKARTAQAKALAEAARHQEETAALLRARLDDLSAQIESVRRKRADLQEEMRTVDQSITAADAWAALERAERAAAEMERVEKRINRAEFRAIAIAELATDDVAAEFAKLEIEEQEEEIEQELGELKTRL